MLKGVKKATPESSGRRLPITPTILRAIKAVWQKDSSPPPRMRGCYGQPLAYVSLCYVSLCSSGRAKSYAQRKPNLTLTPTWPLQTLRWTAGQPHPPSAMQVRIKASKTDPFRQGVTLHIGVAEGALCPVAAVLTYMVSKGGDPGPLFTWVDGRFLTRNRFVAGVRAALTSAGYTAADYAGHSFRIGAATTASQRGIQDSLIQTLGRWQSSAYTRYILTVPETLQGVAKTSTRLGNCQQGTPSLSDLPTCIYFIHYLCVTYHLRIEHNK